MFPYLIRRDALAEVRHIPVFTDLFFSAPGMVGSGDLVDLFIGKIFVGPVDEVSQFTDVDKKRLPATGAKLAVLLVAGEKPEAHRNLCRIKKLPGHGDHAVHQVRLDHIFANFPFAIILTLNPLSVLLDRLNPQYPTYTTAGLHTLHGS